MAAANKAGRGHENKAIFHVAQKHKSCHKYEGPAVQVVIFKPFHHPRALLHLFVQAFGRDGVCHLWVVNSLPAMGAHERPLFIELLARVVSPRIYIRC